MTSAFYWFSSNFLVQTLPSTTYSNAMMPARTPLFYESSSFFHRQLANPFQSHRRSLSERAKADHKPKSEWPRNCGKKQKLMTCSCWCQVTLTCPNIVLYVYTGLFLQDQTTLLLVLSTSRRSFIKHFIPILLCLVYEYIQRLLK